MVILHQSYIALLICLLTFTFSGCNQNPVVSQIRLRIKPLKDSQMMGETTILDQSGKMEIYAYDVNAERLYTPVEFPIGSGEVQRQGAIPSLPLGNWKFYLHGQTGGQFMYGMSAPFEIEEEEAFEIQVLTGRSECIGQLPLQPLAYEGSVDLPGNLAGQSSVALEDGRILITGGATVNESTGELNAVSNQIMLFDPTYGTTVVLADSLNVARAYHQATLLRDGRVVLTGGISDGKMVTNSIEVLKVNPDRSIVVETASNISLGLARAYHQAIFLADPEYATLGRTEYDSILISGGVTADGNITASTVRYFPEKNIVVPQGNLTEAKAHFTLNSIPRQAEPAVAIGGLSNGSVSGSVELFSINNNASCGSRMENVDPNLVGCWLTSATLNIPRWGHQSQTIPNAGLSVLIMGGFAGGSLDTPSNPIPELEVFDTIMDGGMARPQVRQNVGVLSVPTGFATSSSFFDGSVLYVGGQDGSGNSRREAVKISTVVNNGQVKNIASLSLEPSCPLSEDRMQMNGVKTKDDMFFLIGGKRQGRLNDNPYYPTSKRIEVYVPKIKNYNDLSKVLTQSL